MSLKENISNRFDQWVFNSYPMSSKALGLYRILYSIYLLVWGIPNFEWIADNPNSFYNPPAYSLGALLDGFPPYWFLEGLSLLVVLLAILLLFGWHTRTVSILLGLSIIVGKSFAFSFGLIGQDIVVWFIPMLLSFSNWGSSFSIDAYTGRTQNTSTQYWPITMMSLFLGFGMFTAGLPKLLGGWLDPATQATRGHFFTQYYVIGDLKLLAPYMAHFTNKWIWEMMDWVAVLFELSFLVAIINPKWVRRILVVAIIFHTSTFMVLNISFHFQYSLYLLFINWAFINDKTYQRIGNITAKLFNYKVLIAFMLIYVPLYVLSQKFMLMPGQLAPSPFLLLGEWLGADYKILVGATALIPALGIVAWQVNAARNS